MKKYKDAVENYGGRITHATDEVYKEHNPMK